MSAVLLVPGDAELEQNPLIYVYLLPVVVDVVYSMQCCSTLAKYLHWHSWGCGGEAIGTVDVVCGSSQIRVTLVGKEDRREAKCEQLGSVSQSSCYSWCSSRSGSKTLSMPGFSSPYTA